MQCMVRQPSTYECSSIVLKPSQIPPDDKQQVPQEIMRDFIAEGVRRINSKGAFRSTIGFAHHETLAEWDSPGLGITLHQFHYYAQNKRKLPEHNFSDEYPCFIGEFATYRLSHNMFGFSPRWRKVGAKRAQQIFDWSFDDGLG